MKNYYLYGCLILMLSWSAGSFAQTPEKMNYQAVVRDALGQPLASQAITTLFEIRQGTPTGTVVYSENQSLNTNQFGLVTAEIGGGTVVSGNFSTISWGSDIYYLYVEVNGNALGSTQLLSVPYALYAKESLNGPTGAQGPPGISIVWLGTFASAPASPNLNEAYYDSTLGQSFIWDGTTWNIIAQDGTAGSFTAGPGISIVGGVISNTGDLDSLNELQDLSITGNTINISNGTGTPISPTAPVTGDVLYWNGINWVGQTLPPNTDNQDLNLIGDSLFLTNDPTPVDISGYMDNTDAQTLSFSGATKNLTISGGNSIPLNVSDNDSVVGNELISYFGVNSTNDSIVIDEGGTHFATAFSAFNDGDWTLNGADLINGNAGNVGIGTGAPTDKLHVVNGSARIETNPGQNYIALNQSTVEANDVSTGTARFVSSVGGVFHWGSGKTNTGNNDYHIINYPSNRFDMSIQDATGNMGVGTTSPGDRIHAFSGGNGTRVKIENSSNGWAGIDCKNTLGEMFVGVQGPFDPVPGEFHIYDNFNGGQRMVIDAAGNVGIGTPNPEMNLHIGGTNGLMINAAGSGNNIGGIAFRNGYSVMARPFHLGIVSYDLGYASAGFSDGMVISGFDGIAFTTNNSALSNQTLTNVRMVINNAGNVGIGTQSPLNLLHVNGLTRMSGATGGVQFDSRNTGGFYYTAFSNNLDFFIQYGASTPSFRISGHNLLLGEGFVGGGSRLTVGNSGDGSNAVANSWTVFSDRRFKENIQAITNPIQLVQSLNGVTYNWKSSGLKDIGFIAQDVEEVLPIIVHTNEETGYKSMDYARMTPILIEAVKEQQKIIEELQKKQAALEQQLNELKNK
ncbi:MAG: tail fiber domain-containing protein [Flavobacteriales bacterium]|nr:tail fiber domain-containing protein [Flavobacteriales bacterium]